MWSLRGIMNRVLSLDRTARWRLGIVSLLFLGSPVALLLGFDGTALLGFLRAYLPEISDFVAVAPTSAALAFMILYAASVAVSLPATGVLIMVAGFLFGWLDGTLYVVIAATIAATTMFAFARAALAHPDAGIETTTRFAWFAKGFREQALTYVFVMHLVAVFPYAMLIAVPAAFGVRIQTYLVGSALGIIPSTILLAHIGAGVGHVLLQEPFRFANFLTPQIVLGLLGFALLALTPVIWRYLVRRRARGLPAFPE